MTIEAKPPYFEIKIYSEQEGEYVSAGVTDSMTREQVMKEALRGMPGVPAGAVQIIEIDEERWKWGVQQAQQHPGYRCPICNHAAGVMTFVDKPPHLHCSNCGHLVLLDRSIHSQVDKEGWQE